VTPDERSFGYLLRRYRLAALLTQEQLAERAHLSYRTISDLERGAKHTPRRDTVLLLAEALELSSQARATLIAAVQPSEQQPGASEPPTDQVSSRASVRIFLIADLRGYTSFTEAHGDEAAAQLTTRFAALVRDCVERYEGQLVETRGDEVLVAFSSARQALRGAIRLQESSAEVVKLEADMPLQVGIGLDAGEAIPVDTGYRGGALNLAARLCSIAGAGEVFCSEGVIHLARKTNGITFVDRGEVSLKGLSSPVRVIQIGPEGELPTELPPLQPLLVTHPNNLPDESTPFIGREHEIGQIVGMLQDPHIRLVTLTGPGGTGKTRLALQVGMALLDRFRDGVFFVNLAPLADPVLVPSAIAEVLGVKETADRSLLAALVHYLTAKQLLLVLDNYEHLLEEASVAATLLDQCRELHILVTSRIPLHLSREHEYDVPPLSVPDLTHLPDVAGLSQYEAVALFIDRARAVKADFEVTNATAPAVAEMCSRLDGLPLAIELAAARIKLFSPQALLHRLDHRLRLLTGGARDRPTRQQTLRNTIDWSYSLLTGPEQTLFARLSGFVGGCTLEAAEAVCGPEGEIEIVDGVTSLLEQSLLREEGEDEPRFLMLETIREYAHERLDASDAEDAVHHHHAAYYLKLVEDGVRELSGSDQVLWIQRLETEHDNIRAALTWSLERREPGSALRGAIALSSFCLLQGYLTEGRRWVETALAAEDVEPRARGEAFNLLARIAKYGGDYQRATHLLDENLRLARGVGDRRGVAVGLLSLGILTSFSGSAPAAAEQWKESLRLFRDLAEREGPEGVFGSPDRWYVAAVLAELGEHAVQIGNYAEAEAALLESLGVFRDIGDPIRTALGLLALGALERERGQYDPAREHCEEALNTFQHAGYAWGVALALEWLARLAWAQSDYTEAVARAEEALALLREMELGRGARAGILGGGSSDCRYILGIALRELGNRERAIAMLRQSLKTFQALGVKPGIVSCLEGVAGIYSRVGQAALAVRLFGVAAKAREDMGLPLLASERPCHERYVAATRAEFDEDVWQALWEEGRAMSLEEAIACALGESRWVRPEGDEALSMSPEDPVQRPRYSSDQV
jgi:predicted ATPase/class 3 adenylate cyclase